MAARQAQFNRSVLIDTTPLPDSIPKVKELGASSAPLLSASFFIGARCQDFNDDFMKCKTDAGGTAQFDCLKEGRRVTRCARSVIEDINTHCLEDFRRHWECLDTSNHQLWQCRPEEWMLNRCVFQKLKLEKTIPNAAGVPIHQRPHQIFAHRKRPLPRLRDVENVESIPIEPGAEPVLKKPAPASS